MVRAAMSRIHPHELWWQGYREDGRRPPKYEIAKRLGISSGHLSSIYKGNFAPSDELAGKMAEVTRGACSKREILEWHRKNPPVWKRESAVRKVVEDRRRRAARKVALDPTELPEDPGKVH
jgi:transcriptional regulator with XRE-family HTH domain